MNVSMRRICSLILGLALLSLADPMSTARACERGTMAEFQAGQVAKKQYPRCEAAGSVRSAAQLSLTSCRKSKASDVRATTPATVTPAPATGNNGARKALAPKRRVRDSASPPASYLSDYLRL